MAILQIARMGHPVLQRRADPVRDPSAAEIARLVADMIETMREAPGVGLAAPQVHVPLRLVVFHVPAERAAAADSADGAGRGGADGPVPLTVLINPFIEVLDPVTETAWEGCLSVPGLTGPVPRARRIRYTGLAADGTTIERVAEGFHARVVQHECDHLDGILYPQRMTDLSCLSFIEEAKRYTLASDARQTRPAPQRA